MKVLVIIPTYNEKGNISPLVEEIYKQGIPLDILFVDDNSPDATFDEIIKVSQKFPTVHLLKREKKQGLGKAYIAGFQWGIEKNYDFLCEMDADFSHRPVDLKNLILTLVKEGDYVIGSRYVEGGGCKNWGLVRRLISRGGSFYARTILGYPIRDWTGGFNLWKKSVLIKIGLENIKSEGYSFQIELKFRASQLGFKVKEVPILFEERRVGQSKMSFKIFMEAIFRVWQIKSIK